MTEKVKTLHLIDLFISRHMNVKRWIVTWSVIGLIAVYLLFQGWWALLGLPMALIAAAGIIGNAGRVQ